MLVLTSGQVKIWIAAPNGREVILAVFAADELLGKLSAIDGTRRSASATAISDVEVLALSLRDFAALVDARPKIANALLHTVAARLRETSRRQLEFGTADALGRLARCILGLADRYGRDSDASRRLRIQLLDERARPDCRPGDADERGARQSARPAKARLARSSSWSSKGTAEARINDELVGTLSSRSFFGELALLDQGSRTATVTASTAMTLLVLSRVEFHELIVDAIPSVTRKMIYVLGARLRQADQRASSELTSV